MSVLPNKKVPKTYVLDNKSTYTIYLGKPEIPVRNSNGKHPNYRPISILPGISKVYEINCNCNCNLFPTEHLGVHKNSLKRIRAFQIELEFESVRF